MSRKTVAIPTPRDIYDAVTKANLAPRKSRSTDSEDPADVRERMEATARKICGLSLDELLRKQPKKDRLPWTWSRLLRASVAARWGVSVKTLGAFFPRPDAPPRRRPSLRSCPKFYEDLRTYGGAQFDANGKLDRASLNRGPDELTFWRSTTPGSDKRLSA